jgi:histidine triad (HIT) family protein
MNCLFCRIVKGEIPAKIVKQNEHALAFRDLHPAAPTHLLVIPKVHVADVSEATDSAQLGHVFALAREVALEEGLAADGYRLVVNTGANAGQSVFHLHMHVLGGRAMAWPPG